MTSPAGVEGRILVVDDEPDVCDSVCEVLRAEGYFCDFTLDAAAAVQRLAVERFDIVIGDLNMPGISGGELLAHVRAWHPEVGFIVISGETDVRVAVDALTHGAGDYVLKPLQFGMLLLSIRRTLERARMQRDIEQYRAQLQYLVEVRTAELRQAMQTIEQNYDQTLQALGRALELRDSEVAGHSVRVTCVAVEIGLALPCTSDQLTTLIRGAHLHDIGKLGIPDAILLKPGALSDEERGIMQSHVLIGHKLVSTIPLLAPAAEIVLLHHERFDGAGYPRGLSGAAIPLGARVFSVADAFDAMISDRPYRAARTIESARDEIAAEAGRQFDPDVVRAFLSVPLSTFHRIRQRVAERGNLDAWSYLNRALDTHADRQIVAATG
jgi:response regulator RpfG family c-di-GMP phosphodiesterase